MTHIDINLTSTCNYGCKYCSEGHNPHTPSLSRIENAKTKVPLQVLIHFLDGFKNSDEIKIGFWGGEPLLNFQYSKQVMLHYADDPKYSFLFYTNGYYVPKYINELIEINSCLGNRLQLQISYDGRAVNDIERLTKSGKSTSDRCIEAFKLLKDNQISTTFKSTVSSRTFKYMFYAFKEIVEDYGAQYYFPTPDCFSEYSGDWQDDLQVSLIRIAKYIYDRKLPASTFKWFSDSKKVCKSGDDYYAIDIDGEIVPCHSLMYDTFSYHRIGSIYDIDIHKKLIDCGKKYAELANKIRNSCPDCNTRYCMKCPAGAFGLHQKHNLSNDYDVLWATPNPNMCEVFKISDMVYNSLLKAQMLR